MTRVLRSYVVRFCPSHLGRTVHKSIAKFIRSLPLRIAVRWFVAIKAGDIPTNEASVDLAELTFLYAVLLWSQKPCDIRTVAHTDRMKGWCG